MISLVISVLLAMAVIAAAAPIKGPEGTSLVKWHTALSYCFIFS